MEGKAGVRNCRIAARIGVVGMVAAVVARKMVEVEVEVEIGTTAARTRARWRDKVEKYLARETV